MDSASRITILPRVDRTLGLHGTMLWGLLVSFAMALTHGQVLQVNLTGVAHGSDTLVVGLCSCFSPILKTILLGYMTLAGARTSTSAALYGVLTETCCGAVWLPL